MNKRRKLVPLRYVLILCAAAVGFSSSVHAQRSTSTRPQAVQQPGTERSGAFSPEPYCPAPEKFAAGACVAACSGGYEDRGRFCQMRSN